MVLKSAFVAAVCTGVLALCGPAMADQYRPSEFLKLELPKAVFSSKRIGPETRFAPVRIEARSDGAEAKTDASDADLEASVWPKLPPRKARAAKTSVKPDAEKARAAAHTNARVKLAKRHSNPLDAHRRKPGLRPDPLRREYRLGKLELEELTLMILIRERRAANDQNAGTNRCNKSTFQDHRGPPEMI